ncbi:MAG: efflux RND transporter periplasmic adaptor subunit [Planctomycetota bacterium]
MTRYRLPLAAGLTAGALMLTQPAGAQTPVRVASVRVESLQQQQAVTGSLRAVARGDIAALESGKLLELTVREGDKIREGDVIARVDARRLTTQRSAANADKRVAEAELKRHQATAKRAAADLERGQRLIQQNSLSRQELDRFQAAYDIATAEIDAAKQRIDRAGETIRLLDVRLSDTTVTAPYNALVVARHLEPGDWVQPGDKLLTVVSDGPIQAWLEVPERLAVAIQQDASNIIVQSAALERTLHVTEVKRLADINRRVRTISLIATLENRDGLLVPGMSVEGWVPAGKRGEFMTVPKDAIIRRSGQPTVFAIDHESKARQVPVRILFENADRVAVESPTLSSNSSVVIEGNERLMPQQAVSVIPTDEEFRSAIAKR